MKLFLEININFAIIIFSICIHIVTRHFTRLATSVITINQHEFICKMQVVPYNFQLVQVHNAWKEALMLTWKYSYFVGVELRVDHLLVNCIMCDSIIYCQDLAYVN